MTPSDDRRDDRSDDGTFDSAAESTADGNEPAKTRLQKASKNPSFGVGMTFLTVAVVFFLIDSTRGVSYAFLPLGIVFLSLAFTDAKPDDGRSGD